MDQAPINIADIFHIDDSDDERNDGKAAGGVFKEEYEVATIQIRDISLKIRQFSWHKTNANKIWPGTFRLAEYITYNSSQYKNSRILELGAATGALSLYLQSDPTDGYDMVTSDVDDGGEVENNIAFNFQLNDNAALPPHIPFTWGSDWNTSVSNVSTKLNISPENLQFDFIIASDILLYVSTYPALVQSLVDIFLLSSNPTEKPLASNTAGSTNISTLSPKLITKRPVREFLMSWNRRIAESQIFFTLMEANGFICIHRGQCIYSFTKK